MSPEPVLVLEGVSKRYGALDAVDDVSLTLEPGVRHAVIGPNGAGKSTLFNLVAGTVKPSGGKIIFAGNDVTRYRDHRRTRLGMSRTFQHSSLFEGLTVHENIALAVQRARGHARNLFRPAGVYRDVERRSAELLDQLQLGGVGDVPVTSLAHGDRRQLEVALALATEPRLLLLDEPTAGMARADAKRFIELIGALPEELTVMLVEHDMDIVFGVATQISVLDAGRLIATGLPEEIRSSAAVQEAYLGPGERMEQLFETA